MRFNRLLCAAAALLGMACLSLSAAAQVAKATLTDASGKAVGEVNFLQTINGVLMRLEVKGLPAGEHAFPCPHSGKMRTALYYSRRPLQPRQQEARTRSG
jgi:superoxide dismutase, Cu-Zn family